MSHMIRKTGEHASEFVHREWMVEGILGGNGKENFDRPMLWCVQVNKVTGNSSKFAVSDCCGGACPNFVAVPLKTSKYDRIFHSVCCL